MSLLKQSFPFSFNTLFYCHVTCYYYFDWCISLQAHSVRICFLILLTMYIYHSSRYDVGGMSIRIRRYYNYTYVTLHYQQINIFTIYFISFSLFTLYYFIFHQKAAQAIKISRFVFFCSLKRVILFFFHFRFCTNFNFQRVHFR